LFGLNPVLEHIPLFRSLSAEVVTLLEYALEEPGHTQAEVLDNIRRRRFFEPKAVYAPDSTTLLRQDRER